MAQYIRKNVAQQIVETVKDVSGHDINFIDKNGIIFASTDPTRVGDFHEIGLRVVKTGDPIEVETDDSFLGTHRGVNLPILWYGELIAAIGISGSPDEVRKYAYLAQRITTLILREQELDERNGNEKAKLNYLIRSLTSATETANIDFLTENLKKYELKMDTVCRTIIVRRDAGQRAVNISHVETAVLGAFEQTGSALYTFHYPGDYVQIMEAVKFNQWAHVFRRLASDYTGILKIAVGSADTLMRQNRSFETAKIALLSLFSEKNFAVYDDLDFDILLGSIPEHARNCFLEKTALSLTESDRELLETYFNANMSLKAVSEKLFMHKNTIQYKLDKIAREVGYNPRIFQDAVILYLALKIIKCSTGASSTLIEL